MFAIELYETTGFDSVQTKLFSPTISVRRWSERINAPGSLYFTIPKDNAKATITNLRQKRRVRLFRRSRETGVFLPAWLGFIQDIRDVGPNREVICDGMLAALDTRRTAENEQFNGQGGTEVAGLLSDVNGAGATGISMGTTDVTTTRDVLMSGRATVADALEKIAQAHDSAEYQVNMDAELDFVQVLGTDKSGTIHVIYREDGGRGKNLTEMQIAYLGKPMANKIYPKSSAAMASDVSDSSSISTYGLLEDEVTFNEAQDATTLTAMATSRLSQTKQPIPDFRIIPETSRKVFDPVTGTRALTGLQYEDIEIGDLIKATIITPNESTQEVVKRVAEIVVDVDENGKERISFTLSDAGVFVTAGYLNAVGDRELRQQIHTLEAAL
ncbi:hypothetical protein [Blastopirellula marina]|uniref:Uncharacterized protein n=1 Tax=Blastopirellula marina TaxID=124 RepID=A0A2S8GSG2_9BACT|nr:hypothetical protein [Blastopirellula marina]PQO47367.1 hypothetical protein C5Y93_04815 [Blastopirellula marina]